MGDPTIESSVGPGPIPAAVALNHADRVLEMCAHGKYLSMREKRILDMAFAARDRVCKDMRIDPSRAHS